LIDIFKGKKLIMTPNRDGDATVLAAWEEDARFLRFMDTDRAYPRSYEAIAESENRESEHFSFRLRTKDEERLIGFIALHGIEWNNRTGSLAIGIGDPDDRGKGYGIEGIHLLLRYAFHELDLHRVSLDVIGYNDSAVRAYERTGFRLEGRQREAVYRDGARYDRLYMGILKAEWVNPF